MNSKHPSGSRLWDSESRLIIPARLLQPQPPSEVSLQAVFMWTSPHTQHLGPGWAGQEEPEENRGLSSCPWHHLCGRTASPAQMEGLEARTQASPRLWCDLAKSPFLPCPTPPLELRGWAGTWKAPASSHIYYFRIPPPLAVFLPALWSPRLPMCLSVGPPQTSP